MAAVLLNCQIDDYCRFDRKHYFYPDLPLGYQITQKTHPIAKNGFVNFYAQSDKPSTLGNRLTYEKRICIQHLQLEMDSGKIVRNADSDLLDLNRSGIALVEIVTAPDFNSPIEVVCFVEHLRILLAQNGICVGHLNEGNLRVDVNISIAKGDDLGRKVELKNLGTIEDLQYGITTEIARQIELLKKGDDIFEETRAINARGETFAARTKGELMDYRFLPEPNLPPIAIEPIWIENAKRHAQLDLLHVNYIRQFGFTPMFAISAVKSKKIGHFIQTYLAYGHVIPFDRLLAWLNELEFLCQKLTIDYPPANATLIQFFAELIYFEYQRKLTKLICIDLLREFVTENGSPLAHVKLAELVERRQLWRISAPEQIEQIFNEVLAECPAGFSEKLRAKKIGQRNKQFLKLKRKVIDKSQKRVHPEDVEAAIWHWIDCNTAK